MSRPTTMSFVISALLCQLGCSHQLLGDTLPAPEKLFPADAIINVTLPPYNAIPNDGKDDTAALQRAITDNVDTGRTLYLPSGTYDVSNTLKWRNAKGHGVPHVTLQGQQRDKTILKLKDNALGFMDLKSPKPVLETTSLWSKGDAADGGGNKAFRNNIFDLTIDTGKGNVGAIGIDYAVSNIGGIENVTVKSGDGKGIAGISMRRKIPGPGLIKNVSIEGFDIALDYSDCQYGMTLEHVTIRNQNQVGIRLGDNALHIRKLTSINKVPAIQVTRIEGVLTILDSDLKGSDKNQYAIDCAGRILLKNVKTSGYQTNAMRFAGRGIPGPDYRLFSGPAPLLADPSGAFKDIPVKETPNYWNNNLADWVAVGHRKPGETDDTKAIQRAFDSGKSTVYFVNNRIYFLSDTVVVRGKVKQVLGMGAEINLGAAKQQFSQTPPRPLIRIDKTDADSLFFENMFFNAQYPGEVVFENNSPRDVIIRHCAGWIGNHGKRRSYRNTDKATGDVFLEDVFMPGWDFRNQNVWARQLNPECNDGDGSRPQIQNTGGKLWILGFKTEGTAPFIVTTDGATTQLFGAYNYISATDLPVVPPISIPYLIKDSSASLAFTTNNFRSNDYSVYIRCVSNNKTVDFKPSDLYPRNGKKGDASLLVPYFQSSGKLK